MTQSQSKAKFSLTLLIFILLSFFVVDTTGDILVDCFQDLEELEYDSDHNRRVGKTIKTPMASGGSYARPVRISFDLHIFLPPTFVSGLLLLNFEQSGAKLARELTTISLA